MGGVIGSPYTYLFYRNVGNKVRTGLDRSSSRASPRQLNLNWVPFEAWLPSGPQAREIFPLIPADVC
jgi:hypothetical protein